jgi:hypothetical protein
MGFDRECEASISSLCFEVSFDQHGSYLHHLSRVRIVDMGCPDTDHKKLASSERRWKPS